MARKTTWTAIGLPSPGIPQTAQACAVRGRRRKSSAAGTLACIPIVNSGHEIVAWTDSAPAVESGRLRHSQAERVLGGPIFCTQVALMRPPDILRAGGPANWVGPWRCLALCRIEDARGLEQPLAAPMGEMGRGPARKDSGSFLPDLVRAAS